MQKPYLLPDFDVNTGLFLLRIRPEDIGFVEEPVRVGDKVFQPKDEVHITIIGTATGSRLVDKIAEAPEIEVLIRRRISEIRWGYELLDEWYHVVERSDEGAEEAESIIRMVRVNGLAEFYKDLQEVLGEAVQLPPTHITLYWIGLPLGIGISNQHEFDELVQRRVQPEDINRLV